MKTYALILISLMTSLMSFSQTYTLKVIITDIEDQKGTIFLSLHNNEDSFPSGTNETVKTGKIEKFDSTAEFNFSGLEQGEYAISFFQDLNGNEEMDTNFVGFPKEPVGASKMTSLGRPKFSKCKFMLTENKTIQVQYMN